MNTKVEQLQKEYFETLNRQKFVESDLDYSILEYHINILKKLDVIGTGMITIFDLNKKDHVYISSKFASVFGWDIDDVYKEGPSFFDSRIHPDDYERLLEVGNYYFAMALEISPENRKNYKLINEYRIKNNSGKYIKVIEQHSALELDKHNNVWLALCIMDLSPNTDINTPFTSRAMNFRTGETYMFPPKNKLPVNKSNLTSRETEILELLSMGLLSKEIADKLYISVNTVNTHRQRILEKLDANNTIEAIKYASNNGLILM